MHKVQEELNNICNTVCKDLCKYTEKVNGRNLLNANDPNAFDDEEFDSFVESYCFKCQINDLFME